MQNSIILHMTPARWYIIVHLRTVETIRWVDQQRRSRPFAGLPKLDCKPLSTYKEVTVNPRCPILKPKDGATDGMARAGKDERRGDTSRDRMSVAVVVRIQCIHGSQPRQGGTFQRVAVIGTFKFWRGENSDVRMNIDNARYSSSTQLAHEPTTSMYLPWSHPCTL